MNFFSRKDSPTYKFYNPSVAARQFGLGQMPIGVHFVARVKFREPVSRGFVYNRLCNLTPDSNTIDLSTWLVVPFSTQQFKLCWAEWKQHLFCATPVVYCNQLDPAHADPNAEVTKLSRPIPHFYFLCHRAFITIFSSMRRLIAECPQCTAGVAGR